MTTATIYSTPGCVKCRMTDMQLSSKLKGVAINHVVLDSAEKIDAFKETNGIAGGFAMPFVQVKENDEVVLSWNDMRPDMINEAVALATQN